MAPSHPESLQDFRARQCLGNGAKTLVSSDPAGAAIDMPAGPSEVLVIADEGASAEFVASDLLSQAEHGPDSQVVLLTTSATLATKSPQKSRSQLSSLRAPTIAAAALEHSRIFLVDAIEDAVSISNRYAPEHLILQVAKPRRPVAGYSKCRVDIPGTMDP